MIFGYLQVVGSLSRQAGTICDWWDFTGVPFPGPDQVVQFLDIK